MTRTREAALLAVSLSINNLGGGLGAGISHVHIALTAALTAGASGVAIAAGYLLGRRASFTLSRRWLGMTAGVIFIGAGIYELFV